MDKIIFIVDDNDANLVVAGSALEDEYRVLTMPSARKMFSLLEKRVPDLILLDIEMPDVSGFEAIARLKENPRFHDIPVIFLTGRHDDEFKSIAEETQALDIIYKPINVSALKACVKKHIN